MGNTRKLLQGRLDRLEALLIPTEDQVALPWFISVTAYRASAACPAAPEIRKYASKFQLIVSFPKKG